MAEPAPITIWVHSDDCAGIQGRNNVDESAFWGRWWPIGVDGEAVGEIMVDYGSDGWEFSIRAFPDHDIEIIDDPALLPEGEDDDAWWADEDE